VFTICAATLGNLKRFLTFGAAENGMNWFFGICYLTSRAIPYSIISHLKRFVAWFAVQNIIRLFGDALHMMILCFKLADYNVLTKGLKVNNAVLDFNFISDNILISIYFIEKGK